MNHRKLDASCPYRGPGRRYCSIKEPIALLADNDGDVDAYLAKEGDCISGVCLRHRQAPLRPRRRCRGR